jgi:ribosome-binding protein aMBF1 (putative translation factor)
MARNDPQIALRLPQDLKDWVEEEARRNGSSQNSEVVRALRERQSRVGPAPAPEGKRLSDFSTRLISARVEMGLTQRQLAELIGVDHSQLSRYEAGTAIPRPAVVNRIAEVFDVDYDFFRKALPGYREPRQFIKCA